MKTPTLLAALSLAGLCVSPLCAQDAPAAAAEQPVAAPASGSLADKAAELAGRKAADISDICNALYEAVKADKDNADKVFARVLSQRAGWTPAEVYRLFRAVLAACPELVAHADVARVVEAGGAEAAEAERAAAEYQAGAPSGTGDVPPMLENIVDVLYQSPTVSDEAVRTIVNNIAATSPAQLEQLNRNVNAGRTSIGAGQNTNATATRETIAGDTLPGDVVPGGGDISPAH